MVSDFVFTKEYIEHQVFQELKNFSKFYERLSFLTFGIVTAGVSGKVSSIDSYVYSSIQATLESIKEILLKGRINDAYTLLRKYHDSIIINIYTILYLDENKSFKNIIVEKIDNWVNGSEQLPEFRVMSQYIADSKIITEMKKLIDKDSRYKQLRNRCNDHTHYNFFHNIMLNDGKIYMVNRVEILNQFLEDLLNLFILHFAYLFTIRGFYMSSSDYVDSLDVGLEPEEGSQYNVAPFIQEVFDSLIKKYRPDIAKEIKNSTYMRLE